MYRSLVGRVRKGFAYRKDEESNQDAIHADVVEAAQIVQCLTQEPTSTSPPVYQCRYKYIKGRLDLKHHTIETAIDIQDCIFLDEVDLRYCEFTQAVNFSGCIFLKAFNSGDEKESHTVFQKDFSCNETTFRKVASFNGMHCEGSAYFYKARFEGGRTTNFSHAYFGRDFVCRDARFEGTVSFHSIKCEDSGYFTGMCCEGPVDFSYASFGGNLECTRATFGNEIRCNVVTCQGGAFFNNAQIQGNTDIHLRFLSVGTNLEVNGTKFPGRVFLDSAKVSGSLHLAGHYGEANFVKAVSLRNAEINVLVVGTRAAREGSSSSFPFRDYVDLRGCTFNSVGGTREQASRLVESQDPTKFSRDPYLQLEQYYKSTGDEVEARQVRYRGLCALRENAWVRNERNRNTNWPFTTKIWDAILWLLTGYGLRNRRLLGPILMFLLVGTLIFWPDKALEVTVSVSAQENSQQLDSQNLKPKWLYRPLYSVDLFVPVVGLKVAEGWMPKPLWREIYSVIHMTAGWLLIPLMIASMAGIVKNE